MYLSGYTEGRTHEVHVLRRRPQRGEGLRRHLLRDGQEAEDAAAAVVYQHHLRASPAGDSNHLGGRAASVACTRGGPWLGDFKEPAGLGRRAQGLGLELREHTVSGGRSSEVRSRLRPLTSCRKVTSPTTRVTPRPRPSAKPAAVDSTPSMPLAPRLAATGAPRPATGYRARESPPWGELREPYAQLPTALPCKFGDKSMTPTTGGITKPPGIQYEASLP